MSADALLCYVCLLSRDIPREAATTIGGTAVCNNHIHNISNANILVVSNDC